MKLWKGRFQSEEDSRVNDFNSSISFDSRMAREDIEGSLAHARMLGECGIIDKAESEKIIEGLLGILRDLESGALQFDMEAEDIHTFVEGELTARIGDAGKRLHTGRSRNDQVAVDTKLYVKKEVVKLMDEVRALLAVIWTRAEENIDTVMPGYTHLQRAQPVTYAHHLLAYGEMLIRDLGRLEDCYFRMDTCPLGAGALAGTTYPIDRERTATLLGFEAVAENSMDAVSDRDYLLELMGDLSILMVHLSRISEEIVLWCSWEFRFLELSDAFSTGSSIMPQKKNPDVNELIRGKSGRVIGDLVTLLTAMKGLPLAYNKDMQEDKEAAFDAIDTAHLCLTTLEPLMATMKVKAENMRKAAAAGFINATDCADYMVKKGLPFRDAYRIVGEIVYDCTERGLTLETYPLEDYRKKSDVFAEDVYRAIDLTTCVEERRSQGGPARASVLKQLASQKDRVEDIL